MRKPADEPDFAVVRVGWKDAALTEPAYQLRCQFCGAMFPPDFSRTALRRHFLRHRKVEQRIGRRLEEMMKAGILAAGKDLR